MADEKIINFPGSGDLPECSLTIEPPPLSLCDHDRITLDSHRRTVRCTDCDKVFDPFDYLMSNARSITRAWADYRSVRQRQAEKEATVEALTKEEKRLRARVRTLKDKVEPGIDIRGKDHL